MKRVIIILLVVYLFIPVTAFGQQYTISDYDLKIELSDEWDVFTRDNLDSNPNYAKYSTSYVKMKQLLESNSMYMDARKRDNMEIYLRIAPSNSEVINLSDVSEKEFEGIANSLIKKMNASRHDSFKSNKHKYIKVSYYDVKTERFVRIYFTVVNGNNITFTVQNYKGAFTENVENEIDEIVKSTEIKIINEDNFWKSLTINVSIGIAVLALLYYIHYLYMKRSNAK